MPDILRPLHLPDQTRAKSRRQQGEVSAGSDGETVKKSGPSILSVWVSKIPWKRYFFHLPTLILGLVSYAAAIFILTTVEPRSIQHLWLPNSYAPLLIAAGLGHLCVFGFLLLSTRRGILMSSVLTLILFLRLQQVFTMEMGGFIVGGALAVEFFCLSILWIWRKLGLGRRWAQRRVASTAEVPLPKPTTEDTPPPQPHRRHGRQRKHHFFGK
jgi:hypothetical protein